MIEQILTKAVAIVWGTPLLILLFGTHIFFTFRLGFIQKYIFKAIKLTFKKSANLEGEISPFGALSTSIAATVGTGNIIGVSTAVATGGPGAVFWLWIMGVFGIATNFSEVLLSVKYRIKKNGQMVGGAMYIIEQAMGQKWLAILFAIFTIIASFGIGNTVQSNSIAMLNKEVFNLPFWVTGLALSIFTALVILGGIKSIAKTCEFLVPFMAIFYILACIVLLVINFTNIPSTIFLILKSAFSGHAVLGGFAGATISQAMKSGISRGLFSNEAGMGSTAIIAAASKTKNPVRQALISSSMVFWDTVIISALTGIVVVNSGMWTSGLVGPSLSKSVFDTIPTIGPIVLTVGLLTFIASTLIGWSYYGERAMEYLFGIKSIFWYRIGWVVAAFIGSVTTLKVVWTFADIANACMAIPNLISLIFLRNIVKEDTKIFFGRMKNIKRFRKQNESKTN